MIICEAIKDTSTGQVFHGLRHGDIYNMMRCFGYNATSDFLVEGFVDEANNFYDRKEAYSYALEHHQLPRTVLEMTASEARALVKESTVCKEMSLYNDIDNKIREVASKGISLCDFVIEEPKDNQLVDICRHYRNLGFTCTFRIYNSSDELGYVIPVGIIYLSWGK